MIICAQNFLLRLPQMYRDNSKISFLSDSRFWTCDVLILDFVFQNAVSVYIRLGFAHKKGEETD